MVAKRQKGKLTKAETAEAAKYGRGSAITTVM
eukprot:CAMPEP_0183481238 /NCGR_PEP_ID=MMETSP0370-20130417/174585_1 /TAXON_ID=268820 /ORGANISM="Peridinium aciculiferum, Strain PAER-2" /LENGTH=31 /DNA_ID= /DNA_START= /DNA_END= /DNA_ORIENTATION=